AVALGTIAENAAKKLKNVPLVSGIRKRNEEVKELEADFAKVKSFVQALKKNSKDPTASLEVGKYYALTKGNWDKGLPLLAKGGDPALAELAVLDLENPPTGLAQASLGARWSKEATKLQGVAARNALLRAYQWYQQALAVVSAKERPGIEKAMTAINEQLPAEYRIGEIAVELRHFDGHTGPVFGVALSADGSRIASGGAVRAVRLWDGKNSNLVRRFEGPDPPGPTVAVS